MNYEKESYTKLKDVFLLKIDEPCADGTMYIAVETKEELDRFSKIYQSRVSETKRVKIVNVPLEGNLFLIEVSRFNNEFKTSPYRYDNPFDEKEKLHDIWTNAQKSYGKVIVKCDSDEEMIEMQSVWYKKILEALLS